MSPPPRARSGTRWQMGSGSTIREREPTVSEYGTSGAHPQLASIASRSASSCSATSRARRPAIAAFETGIFMMREAGYASEHDALIGLTVGHIMAGGKVTPGTVVDEDYLLELEREGFLKLVGTKKSQERIEHMLKKGKPLRN